MNPADGKHRKQTTSEREQTPPVWDMSQERAFVENLLNQRFNFFLVFFSVVVAGSVNAKTQPILETILGVGWFITLLLAMVLHRTQEKLDIILAELFTDDLHPATIVDRRARKCFSMRWIIGYLIPPICFIILVTGFILALCDVLSVPKN